MPVGTRIVDGPVGVAVLPVGIAAETIGRAAPDTSGAQRPIRSFPDSRAAAGSSRTRCRGIRGRDCGSAATAQRAADNEQAARANTACDGRHGASVRVRFLDPLRQHLFEAFRNKSRHAAGDLPVFASSTITVGMEEMFRRGQSAFEVDADRSSAFRPETARPANGRRRNRPKGKPLCPVVSNCFFTFSIMRMLHSAGTAPGCPEIHHDGFAFKGGQRQRAAFGGGAARNPQCPSRPRWDPWPSGRPDGRA